MNRPRLIVSEERRRSGWDALTWESRQGYRDRNGERVPVAQGMGMSAQELIAAMGPIWANHPDHVSAAKFARPTFPLPNLVKVGRGPQYNIPAIHSFWGLIGAVVKWVMR